MPNSFIARYGSFTEEYSFYNGTEKLRYSVNEHIYYLVKDNDLIPLDGVSTICHILDKSNALVPWAAKMVIEKLLTTLEPLSVEGTLSIPFSEFRSIALQSKTAPRERLEEAADIGKQAHRWIENYINAILTGDNLRKNTLLSQMPQDVRASNCCVAALKWMQKHNVRWEKTECKVYSRTHAYAGTLDGIAVVDSCDDELCCREFFRDHLSLIDWKSSNHLYVEYLFQTAGYEQAYEEEHGVCIKDSWVLRLGKQNGDFEPWYMSDSNFAIRWQGFKLCLDLSRLVKQVKHIIDERKRWVKGEKKAALLLAKEAALKIKCSYSDRYKGTKPPRCNGGKGCEACCKKFEEERNKKIIKTLTPDEINSRLFVVGNTSPTVIG